MEEKNEVKVRFSTVVYLFIILVLVVVLGLVYYLGFVKGDNANNVISNGEVTEQLSNNQVDEIAKDLFERGSQKIRETQYTDYYQYEKAQPLTEKTINGEIYEKRNVLYSDVEKEYSEIFTGEALTFVLGKRFAEIDGYLYVIHGGATGWDITNIRVSRISENNNEIQYTVTYNDVEIDDSITEEYSCKMTVKLVDGNYRISETDYMGLNNLGTNNITENSTVIGSNYVWEEYPEDFRKELASWAFGNSTEDYWWSEDVPVTIYSLSKKYSLWWDNPFSNYIHYYILSQDATTEIQRWESNYSQYDMRYFNEKINIEKYTDKITYKTGLFNEVCLRTDENTIEEMANSQYKNLVLEEKNYHYTDIPEDRSFYYEIPSMLVMNGNNTSEEAYKNNARAKKIKVIVNNEKEFVFNLKDTNAVQVFDLDYKQNTIEKPVSITVEVVETYAGEKTEDIYISDLQFSINSNIPQGR